MNIGKWKKFTDRENELKIKKTMDINEKVGNLRKGILSLEEKKIKSWVRSEKQDEWTMVT